MPEPVTLGQAFALAQAVILMIGGGLYSGAVKRMSDLEAQISRVDERVTAHGEKIAALGANQSEVTRRLDRIESKLDALIQLGGGKATGS